MFDPYCSALQDTKATQRIIGNGVSKLYLLFSLATDLHLFLVRDSIFRGYLQSAALV